MTGTRTYKVTSAIRHGGRTYEAGECVEMPPAAAAPLLALGRLVDAQGGENAQVAATEAQAALDRVEAQKLRDAAADDAFKAASDRDMAEKALADAKELAAQAAADRDAAEKALAEAKALGGANATAKKSSKGEKPSNG